MSFAVEFKERLFNATSETFPELALELFHFQSQENPIYQEYLRLRQVQPEEVQSLTAIPFLPIEAFKHHKIITRGADVATIFTSSGTTGQEPSRHYVRDLELYEAVIRQNFLRTYGKPEEYLILALLPSYLERSGSSLIYMLQRLIEWSEHPKSSFYLHDHEALAHVAQAEQERKVLLIGVSFALLDLAEKGLLHRSDMLVMETGGMKGRRQELTRQELHRELQSAFGVPAIHSEYGMTELLSHAYSTASGRFEPPPWMQVVVTDLRDPLSPIPDGQRGRLNVLDLANCFSCPFIATGDVGIRHADGSFEVLGRLDLSEVRGCNLMVG